MGSWICHLAQDTGVTGEQLPWKWLGGQGMVFRKGLTQKLWSSVGLWSLASLRPVAGWVSDSGMNGGGVMIFVSSSI